MTPGFPNSVLYRDAVAAELKGWGLEDISDDREFDIVATAWRGEVSPSIAARAIINTRATGGAFVRS